MRRVAVVTVARSDYGLYLPLLRELAADTAVDLQVVAGGAHLSPSQGLTVERIEADGWPIGGRVPFDQAGDAPADVVRALGRGVSGFGDAFVTLAPDLVVVLGDRVEMHAAAVAATPLRLPLAHIHGGELTEGAIDDALRHSMTKLSHLHFVATGSYARRVRQLGEEPWRVSVVGALGLDAVRLADRPSPEDFFARYGLDPARPFLLVTLHPTTLDAQAPEEQADVVLAALERADLHVVYTQPNGDAGARAIEARFERRRSRHPDRFTYVPDFGPRDYLAAMAAARAMVGNSSSGIIEAVGLGRPVVNIGARQDRRDRSGNVIDVPFDVTRIEAAIRTATSDAFRAGRSGWGNPYGDGHAAARIAERLRTVPVDATLVRKRFIDRPATAGEGSGA